MIIHLNNQLEMNGDPNLNINKVVVSNNLIPNDQKYKIDKAWRIAATPRSTATTLKK